MSENSEVAALLRDIQQRLRQVERDVAELKRSGRSDLHYVKTTVAAVKQALDRGVRVRPPA